MRVAQIQVASPDDERVADRRRRVATMVASAAGAELITLPELWAPGYFAFEHYAARAEPLDGATVAAGSEWARALGTWIHLGSIIERGPAGLHNTSVLLDPSGGIAHIYRKVHTFGLGSLEAQLLEPGDSVSVTAGPLGVTGATTCYDLRFGELWRALVDAGAESVIVAAAWPAARLDHWRLLTSARAVEQQVIVVATNATGTHGGVTSAGHSRVVGPWGDVLAEAGTDEGITWAEVDPGTPAQVRAHFPVLADRRTGGIRIATC
ncbi:MAG: carbon-nitrogen family hydrolase [Actinomycetota bacterium]|nr:carbon-nitrogen family hydrolase [Actinomycetota bacterium]MDQ6945850.1 carbon-nitrogen family hydrolase [Actinomycetota bacterium]